MAKAAAAHKTKLREWLDHPATAYEDWAVLSYQEIARRAGVPMSAAYRFLEPVLLDRGYTLQEIQDKRGVEHRRKTNRLSDRQIQRLVEMRSQTPPLGYTKCARELGISRNAVMKRCKKMGI